MFRMQIKLHVCSNYCEEFTNSRESIIYKPKTGVRCLHVFPYGYKLEAAAKASECNLNCINLQWDTID